MLPNLAGRELRQRKYVTEKHQETRAIIWRGDRLDLLDQRLLPHEVRFLELKNANDVARAIRDMVVRGAPAIGITAAYGVVLAAQELERNSRDSETVYRSLAKATQSLAAARPTAVNLSWALKRMHRVLEHTRTDVVAALEQEAKQIHSEDIAANHRMGELGASIIDQPGAVLTHCNAGALATGGHGTALGVVRTGFAQGRVSKVFADETRPWLQGARLTAWELIQDGIPVELLADGAAAWLMKQGQVRWVIVGADRIAANGDTANKIGTYSLAVAARRHGVGFMVVAPFSTIDLESSSGDDIPIENRAPQELLEFQSQRVAADGSQAWNPVFDVTPAELIDAIVTERGIVRPPNAEKIARLAECRPTA